MGIKILHFPALLLACTLTGCYFMRSSNGGGQTKVEATRKILTEDVAVAPGYQVELVARGLTFPTAIAFDEDGQAFVLEAGYCYGEVWTVPKLLQLDKNGGSKTIATGSKNGPWNGMTYHKGNFYVAEGGEMEGGKILKISPNGTISELLTGLPSTGDHHTNGPAVHDGYLYFGQGTATNSGVVGKDNFDFGWVPRNPEFHDIPCKDIVLAGHNYRSDNPLTQAAEDKVETGPFLPFGTPAKQGQTIKGTIPCNGAVMRIPLSGGKPSLVAWGLRNPFGMAFSPDGQLFVTDNAFDDRGSRPVWGAGDVLWRIEQDKWYGWPDYSEGLSVVDLKGFVPPGEEVVFSVLQDKPGEPPHPAAKFGVHSSATGLDFSASSKFGFEGDAFVAQFGDMAPNVGKTLAPVGFKVVRVEVKKGIVHDFMVNKGEKNGPASWQKSSGLERPVSVRFSPDGTALYVVDFGVLAMTDKGPAPQEKTGCIWKITRKPQN